MQHTESGFIVHKESSENFKVVRDFSLNMKDTVTDDMNSLYK